MRRKKQSMAAVRHGEMCGLLMDIRQAAISMRHALESLVSVVETGEMRYNNHENRIAGVEAAIKLLNHLTSLGEGREHLG